MPTSQPTCRRATSGGRKIWARRCRMSAAASRLGLRAWASRLVALTPGRSWATPVGSSHAAMRESAFQLRALSCETSSDATKETSWRLRVALPWAPPWAMATRCPALTLRSRTLWMAIRCRAIATSLGTIKGLAATLLSRVSLQECLLTRPPTSCRFQALATQPPVCSRRRHLALRPVCSRRRHRSCHVRWWHQRQRLLALSSSTIASRITPPSHMSRSVVAPAPAPPGAFIQYYRVPNHADIAANMPTCDFWRPEDLGKKVPDACCSIAAWPASVGFSTGGPDARTIVGDTSGKQPRCYARERVPAPGTFVRNFFGCYEGNLMAAEGCAPMGTSMGHGYPLPSADSAIENSVDGDPVSCNCDKPWYNQGPGCYVALSCFIAGVSPDPTANFLQVSGSCDS